MQIDAAADVPALRQVKFSIAAQGADSGTPTDPARNGRIRIGVEMLRLHDVRRRRFQDFKDAQDASESGTVFTHTRDGHTKILYRCLPKPAGLERQNLHAGAALL